MKTLIIGGLITVAAGVGLFFIGGWSLLGITILIPLFLLAPLFTVALSLAITAIGSFGELVDGFKSEITPRPTTVHAN